MPFISYHYYLRKGHVVKNCNIRKFDVPKGDLKWIPKGTRKDNNHAKPSSLRVPYST